MKFLLPCLTLACAFSALHAEELSDADKAKAIQWLEEYKEKISSGDAKRISDAKSILKRAASDDGAALELLKSSVKKVQFDEKGKSSLDYINWEKSQKELFSNPAFKSGLKLQCHWALIALNLAEAKKKKIEIAFPVAEVTGIYNNIASDPMIIRNKDMATGSHLSHIKRFLKINDLSTDLLPDSPFDIGGLFEKTLLPAAEKTGDIAGYRKMWLWRIDLEKRINIDPDSFSEQDDEDNTSSSRRSGRNDRDNSHDKKKSGGIANDRKSKLIAENGKELNSKSRIARETKIQNKLSELRWNMEIGCFHMGDEKMALNALKAMLMASSDPEQLTKRISALTGLLVSSNESTPAVQSAGDQDMSGDDEWNVGGNTKKSPATAAAGKQQPFPDTTSAPAKPSGPISADGIPVEDDTVAPPAQPQKQPDKASSEDDWAL